MCFEIVTHFLDVNVIDSRDSFKNSGIFALLYNMVIAWSSLSGGLKYVTWKIQFEWIADWTV